MQRLADLLGAVGGEPVQVGADLGAREEPAHHRIAAEHLAVLGDQQHRIADRAGYGAEQVSG
ncbi:hypothetical protein ACFQXA_28210 [Nocardiopsis composta]